MMKPVDTIRRVAPKRRRRHHSAEFKAEVFKACAVAGVSVAAVALEYGLNATLVRRWLRARGIHGGSRRTASGSTRLPQPSGFVPILVGAPSPTMHEIRIELRRGATTVTIQWPGQAAHECAGWLREWLR